eukprot:m51a1_g12995 putative nad+:protein(adp-ribosyl)- adprt (394) ;mRNA; f:417-2028
MEQRRYDSGRARDVRRCLRVAGPDVAAQVRAAEARVPEAKLAGAVVELLKLLYDERMMRAVLAELDIDLARMPLGRLSKKQVRKGFEILKEAEVLLNEPASAKRSASIMDCTNRFFTLIPHAFGRRRPPIIDNFATLREKRALLETLEEMDVAGRVIAMQDDIKENPADVRYRELHSDIEPVPRGSPEAAMVADYVRNSHAPTHNEYAVELAQLFRVNRHGERAAYDSCEIKDNRVLLWHGSRRTNFVGILSNGLRIAPPEAPKTGYMFGKGVYFADMCSKAANYCHCTDKDTMGLVLLCEVALGKCYRTREAEEDMDLERLVALNCNSTMGEGKTHLDPAGTVTLADGVQVQLGKPVPAGIVDSELLYNEYVVYRVDQISVKYIVQLHFTFK